MFVALSFSPYQKHVMANTYSQVHLHFVFAVQNRMSLIQDQWQNQLYKYITSIAQDRGHKVLAIGGTKDHIHILMGFGLEQSISSLMLEIKRDSSAWINSRHFVMGSFSWQKGYGCFSYSKSQIPAVIRYIQGQEQHHSKCSLEEEYKNMLRLSTIDYDVRYILKSIE